MMRGRWWLVALWMTLAFAPGPVVADERGGDDLVRWISGACTRELDPETIVRLDQVAGKAVTDWLRTGRFRDAVNLARAYLDCLERHSSSAAQEVLQDKMRALRQVACFVPLVIFENEGKVDGALAADTLARCPAPPLAAPGGDDRAKRRWAEQVRRYVHLIAAVRPPAEVLDLSARFLAAFAAAGFDVHDPTPGAAVPGGPAAPGDEEVGPDPVFPTRVFAVGAAVAAGRLDRLIEVSGGEDAACKSVFLAALGLLQSMNIRRDAALPLTLRALMRKASLDALVKVARDASARFEGRECMVPAMVSAMAISGLTDDVVDQAVASGRAADLAVLAEAAPTTMMLPGAPASRIEVLERLVAAGGPRRGDRLCELGEARLASGRVEGSIQAFSEAAIASKGDSECARVGRLRAALAAKELDSVLVSVAACDFLRVGADGAGILGVVRGVQDPARRATAVNVLWEAGSKCGVAGVREALSEALVKVVDQEPGSAAAAAAMAVLPKGGGAQSVEEGVIFGLVAGRHHVEADNAVAARKAFADAFKAARPSMESVVSGTASLLRWLAARKRYAVMDDVVKAARKAGVVKPGTLASLAAMVGEVGERGRAMALLKVAQAARPSGADDWLAIANAYARIDEPALAAAALSRLGAERDWGPGPWMTKGRLEMSRKRYREAAAAYGKAAELARDECDPLFFRGLVRLLMGDPEGAEQDFRGCVGMGEDNAQVLGGLGYALFDQSKFADSAKTFREAIAKDDRAADNHVGLALALLRAGDLPGAIEAHRKAAELEPAIGQGYRAAERRGYVYSEVEKAAWDDLTEAVKAAGGASARPKPQ